MTLYDVDFETETVISAFKFKLTQWTLDQYVQMTDLFVSDLLVIMVVA